MERHQAGEWHRKPRFRFSAHRPADTVYPSSIWCVNDAAAHRRHIFPRRIGRAGRMLRMDDDYGAGLACILTCGHSTRLSAAGGTDEASIGKSTRIDINVDEARGLFRRHRTGIGGQAAGGKPQTSHSR